MSSGWRSQHSLNCACPRCGRSRRWPAGALLARAAWALAIGLLFVSTFAAAGVMTRASMVETFPSPLIVGEKEHDLPVWPILKQDGTSTPIIAYVFESIDLAPIPGFAGTPFNLLVMLSAQGEFMDVRVLSQHEPVFLDGLGEGPMIRFADQYKGLSLSQNIKIGSNLDGDGKTGSANVYIDGVAKATASVRILNQSLLSASLKVARAKLGYAEGRDPDLIARIKPDTYAPMSWDELVKAGLITRKRFRNRDIDQAFRGTVGEGLDSVAVGSPDDDFIDLYFAYLNVPAVGRNLLTADGWQLLQRRLAPGDHALLVMGSGRYSIFGEEFVRGTVPDRLTLHQQSLPIEIRDLDLDARLQLPARLPSSEWRVFRVIAPAGLDPSQDLDFRMYVTRSKGMIYPERVSKNFAIGVSLPEQFYESASSNNKTWHSIWTARALELAVLAAALAILVIALRRQAWLTGDTRRLDRFRTGYLLFTLCFIGWYAQGQLSIVNLTALIQAIAARRDLGFFLYDPMTVILWLFVLVTLVAWGRGTFCGWLCPFGALQELIAKTLAPFRLRQIRVPERLDARLKWVKYGALGVILGSAGVSVAMTDRLVEVEPFKTSITLMFVRDWQFVVWSVGLLALGTVVYKGYCRYLCPLGAGLAILGRLRRMEWVPRRGECGQPCQRCRNDCAYQAIDVQGNIDYEECFQCLDCVAIYQSTELCVPLIVKSRKASRRFSIPETPEIEVGDLVRGEA